MTKSVTLSVSAGRLKQMATQVEKSCKDFKAPRLTQGLVVKKKQT